MDLRHSIEQNCSKMHNLRQIAILVKDLRNKTKQKTEDHFLLSKKVFFSVTKDIEEGPSNRI